MRLARIGVTCGVLVAAIAPIACGGNNNDGSTSGSSGAASSTPTTSAGSGAGASKLPQGSEQVNLNPADFTTQIDNPYWPMKPGSRWVYREGSQKVVVTITDQTKRMADGIEARVVHDVVTENGQPREITDDWYAQDSGGNLWYMGEDTAEYENGKVASTAGSWQAGVDGAQPGIALPAKPEAGLSYRQEYYAGEAEDRGEVLSLDAKAAVPYGRFDRMLRTRDSTPLEPNLVESKYYAKGLGPVLSTTLSGGSDREVLLSYSPGS